jgi:glycosyltransferase involved in cell wall biosynthesis
VIKMAEPLVSVIIPTYNHANFIGDAIRSVIAQTYNIWELIIVNNYSEDNTAEIVQSFKNQKIRLINFHNNGIIAASRNEGIKNSTGDFIAFLDSDDIWFPEKLEKQIKLFKRHPDLMLIGTNGFFFPGKNKKILKINSDLELSLKKLLLENKILNSSAVIRKIAVDSTGYLDESLELCAIEDYDYWLRILNNFDNSALVLKKQLFLYRIHNTNISGNETQRDYIKEFNQVIIIIEKYRQKMPEYIEYVYKRRRKKALKYQIKLEYYIKKLNLIGLLKTNNITFIDKCEIIIKDILNRLFISKTYH